MAHIALIDDDATEALVLDGMLDHCRGDHQLTHFFKVEDFPAGGANAIFDLVVLDRRIPPHSDFHTSLPLIAQRGFQGIVLPVSAAEMPDLQPVNGLNIAAPVLKSDLLTPESVQRVLDQLLGPNQ
jgi:DNA-binding NtrC family response regulator